MQRSSSDRYDTLRLEGLFVVCGALLLVASILVGFAGLTDTYKHEVREVSQFEPGVPSDEKTVSSEELTVTERAILLEAIASDSPVWTSSPVGLEFVYPESPDSAQYTVELGDSLYVFETSAVERPTMMVATGVRVSFGIAGLLLLVAGAIPIVHLALGSGEGLTEPLSTLVNTWLPFWALIVLLPSTVLALVAPLILESVVPVPLNLFLTPFLLGSLLCTAVTMVLLRTADLSDRFVLASALNVPALWTIAVALVVAPASGDARGALTLFLGVASLSVLVGQVLGWYTLRWLENRHRDIPHSPTYWRI